MEKSCADMFGAYSYFVQNLISSRSFSICYPLSSLFCIDEFLNKLLHSIFIPGSNKLVHNFSVFHSDNSGYRHNLKGDTKRTILNVIANYTEKIITSQMTKFHVPLTIHLLPSFQQNSWKKLWPQMGVKINNFISKCEKNIVKFLPSLAALLAHKLKYTPTKRQFDTMQGNILYFCFF